MVVGHGQNQDTLQKRTKSSKTDYMKGQPDLIIQNLHKNNKGLCIEFKTPQSNGFFIRTTERTKRQI